MSRQVTAWRNRVVNRFYLFEANAVTLYDRAHWHFCRELLYRALDGWRDPWVAAHYYTYGLHPDKLRLRLAERAVTQLWQLHKARVARPTAQDPNKLAA